MRTHISIGALLGLPLGLALGLAIAALSPRAAGAQQVSFVHGIDGSDLRLEKSLPLDISIDGVCRVTGAIFGEVSIPERLRPGTIQVGLHLGRIPNDGEEAGGCGGPQVYSAPFSFSLAENATIVAHLNDGGTFRLTKFTNDVRAPANGQARVTVRHVADAPRVDVLAGDEPLLRYLSNGQQAKKEAPGGVYPVVLVASDEPAKGQGSGPPTRLSLRASVNTIVYAVGSMRNDTLTVLVQNLELHRGR